MKYVVEITGPALSFLYFSASSSLKEGFLLGTVEEKQVEIISDISEGSIEPETIIRECTIHGDSVIVGWFSGRRNNLFKPSFRETALHSKLNLQFSQINHIQRFLFVLVQDTLNETSVTREFQAKFFQFDNLKRKWSSLIGSVLNWNQRSSLPNKSLYRSLPTLEPGLLASFEEQANNQGLINENLIEGIFSISHNYLMESLKRIANISSEIAQVELQIAHLKTSEDDSANNSPSPPVMHRRNHKRVSLPIDEEIDTHEMSTTLETSDQSSDPSPKGLRKSSVHDESSSRVASLSKPSSQEY
uniref:Uncharacterized protein n=1 Tax=Daphnia galeata TaxID=27404 RepID=A0A8J2WNR2_9CRUS|nr:unnamed protein product [Daphnia galeata]